jgi:hypothetical protein
MKNRLFHWFEFYSQRILGKGNHARKKQTNIENNGLYKNEVKIKKRNDVRR